MRRFKKDLMIKKLTYLSNILIALGTGITFHSAATQHFILKVPQGSKALISSRFSFLNNKIIGQGTHLFIPGVMQSNTIDFRPKLIELSCLFKTSNNISQNVELRARIEPDECLMRILIQQGGNSFQSLAANKLRKAILKVGKELNSKTLTKPDLEQSIRREGLQRLLQMGVILENLEVTKLQGRRE